MNSKGGRQVGERTVTSKAASASLFTPQGCLAETRMSKEMNYRYINQLQKQPSTCTSRGTPGPGQGLPQQGILQTPRLAHRALAAEEDGDTAPWEEKDRNS